MMAHRVDGKRIAAARTPQRSRSPKTTGTHESVTRGRGRRGLALIELLASFAVLGVIAAVAIPQFRSNTHDLWQAHTLLLADLRQARAYALTRGDHFRIMITSATEYELRRLRDDDNDSNWTADAQALRVRALPDGVTVSSNGGSQFEFNTRGLMINPNAAAVLTLVDSHTGYDRRITVWPSGQVAPL
jgi:Tfp pilus assembly protein FimT